MDVECGWIKFSRHKEVFDVKLEQLQRFRLILSAKKILKGKSRHVVGMEHKPKCVGQLAEFEIL